MLPLDSGDGAPSTAVAGLVVLFTPETHFLDVPPRFRGARRVVATVGPLPPPAGSAFCC